MTDIQPTDIKSRILKLMEAGRVDEATALLNEFTKTQTQIDHEIMKSETTIIESLANSTVADLIKRFPEGFVISPNGQIFVILSAVSSLQYLSNSYPIPPPHGGYVVVSVPQYQEGDEKFGVEKE